MDFKELGSYKEQIRRMFISNPLLIELVMPIPDSDLVEIEDNFLGGDFQIRERNPDTGIYETRILSLIGHLFDVPFIYATVQNGRNAICMDSFVSKISGESINEVTVQLFIMCHKSNIKFSDADRIKYRKLGFYGNRLDCIVQEIGKTINGSRNFGIGKMLPAPNNAIVPYTPNNNFFGKVITYKCSDFMTDYAEKSLNVK